MRSPCRTLRRQWGHEAIDQCVIEVLGCKEVRRRHAKRPSAATSCNFKYSADLIESMCLVDFYAGEPFQYDGWRLWSFTIATPTRI